MKSADLITREDSDERESIGEQRRTRFRQTRLRASTSEGVPVFRADKEGCMAEWPRWEAEDLPDRMGISRSGYCIQHADIGVDDPIQS